MPVATSAIGAETVSDGPLTVDTYAAPLPVDGAHRANVTPLDAGSEADRIWRRHRRSTVLMSLQTPHGRGKAFIFSTNGSITLIVARRQFGIHARMANFILGSLITLSCARLLRVGK